MWWSLWGGGFVCSFIWKKTNNPNLTSNNLGIQTEFVLCYSKNISFTFQKIELDEIEIAKYSYSDAKGKYKLVGLNKTGTINDKRPNLEYIIKSPENTDIYPKPRWRWSKEKFELALKQDRIVFSKTKGNYAVYYKQYIDEDNNGNKITRSKLISNLFFDYGTTTNGTSEISTILEKGAFDYPKPVSLLNRILEIATDKNSIILDSFAGSGTTAHAVLELNKKDGGNRKFILVEMEDYAENITAERVRRVIKGYGKEPGNSATGGDFSFYELGERLLLENGNINESISSEKIKEYIYFSETKEKYEHKGSDFLGECNGVAYYFIYKKDEITTLDFEYLANLKKASSYVIYADVCVLSDETMMKYNITFKKIPRDIKKV